jgi:hypothetical protein
MKLRMERSLLIDISVKVGVLLSSRGVSKQARGVLCFVYLKVDIFRGEWNILISWILIYTCAWIFFSGGSSPLCISELL